MERIWYTRFDTPLGIMWAATSEKGLIGFHSAGTKEQFLNEVGRWVTGEFVEDPSRFKELKLQLDKYFRKEKIKFDITFDQRGTGFQKQVWKEISKIPYSKLMSYGEIAERIGRPKAVRAVGNAVGANPLGLIVPCHRVVHKDGSIGGFGGGLPHKRQLLAWEVVFSTSQGEPERKIDLRQFFEN
jgi:O-6-methylguanine DNA methyltransferase